MGRRARHLRNAARKTGGSQRDSLDVRRCPASRINTVVAYIILGSVFAVGTMLGRAVWPHIVLPFRNPWGVVSPLTLIRFNPANSVVAFALFVFLPVGLLACLFLLKVPVIRRCVAPRCGFFDRARFRWHDSLSKTTTWKCAGVLLAFAAIAAVTSTAVGTGVPLNVFDPFHDGETLGAAVSYDHGQTPYKDFIFCHGFFEDPGRSSVAFGLFGRSIGAVRTLESLRKALLFVLLAVFAMALYPRRLYAALLMFVALVLAANDSWRWPERWISCERMATPLLLLLPRDIATVLFLLSLLWLVRKMRRRRRVKPAALAAAAAALALIPTASFVYSLDRAFYLCAGLLATASLLYFSLPRVRNIRWSYLAGLLAGAGIGALIVALVLGDGLAAFLEYALLIMPRYKELMDGKVYNIGNTWFLIPCLLAAANVYWIGVRALRECQRQSSLKNAFIAMTRKYPVELCLMFLSLFFFRSGLGRADEQHVLYSLLPTYLLSLHVTLRHYIIPMAGRWGLEKALTALGMVAVLCVGVEGACRIAACDLIAENFPLNKPDEDFIPAEHQMVIQALRRMRREHSFSLLTMTNEAAWYYYLDQPCPVRFPVIWFAATRFYQEEVVAEIEKAQVELILWRSARCWQTIDEFDNEQRLPIVTDYLKRNYKPFKTIEDNEIWVRRSLRP
jgi:hypothetical protein